MLSCIYKIDGVAKAITTETFRCNLYTSEGTLLTALVCTIDSNQTANPGKFYLAPASQAVTRTWPAPGAIITDIEVTNDGIVTSTENIVIPIAADLTV